MIDFDYKLRVRYADIDQMGIVYYSRYYEFFEAARTDMLREIGMPYSEFEKSGLMLPVIESFCQYKKGAQFDKLINVKCIVNETPKAKIKIEYIVNNIENDEILVTGYTIHAFINKNGKPCRAPQNFVNLFN